MSNQKIINGCCIATMKQLKSCSIGATITDPPYEISFMNKGWDGTGIAFNTEVWKEVLRVTKPGGFLFAFGGTRTAHRMAVAIEDSGWVCRDYIEWVYGSGFPKAQDISKKLGEEWSGYKTPALKPAHEPIYIFQKPMVDEGEPNTIDFEAPFFYCAKTGSKERNFGVDDLPVKATDERTDSGKGSFTKKGIAPAKNNHPCLKPIKLLSYLLDLVTPPESYKKNFVILDPFMGSGSMGCACAKNDVNYIGIEIDEEYCKIAQARIKAHKPDIKELFE